ncbi:MAG: hypothetical protein EXS05_17255 [Planctomycetaceae bacterium]|nr:hypothetical protein [Planctomycetaceae bacterium]
MIPVTQREALTLLAELCELSPDVRLGQLLAHLGFLGEDQTGRTLWNIDDEQLLAVLYQHRSELAGKADSSNEALQQTRPATSVSGS